MDLSELVKKLKGCDPCLIDGSLSLIVPTREYKEIVFRLGEYIGSVNYNSASLQNKSLPEGKMEIGVSDPEGVLLLMRMGMDFLGMTQFFAKHRPNSNFLKKEMQSREQEEARRLFKKYERLHSVSDHDDDELILGNLDEVDADVIEQIADILELKSDIYSVSDDGEEPEFQACFLKKELVEIHKAEKDEIVVSWLKRVGRSEDEERSVDPAYKKFIDELGKLHFFKIPNEDKISALFTNNFDFNYCRSMCKDLSISMGIYHRVAGEVYEYIEFSGLEDLQLLAELGLDFEYMELQKTRSFAKQYSYVEQAASIIL